MNNNMPLILNSNQATGVTNEVSINKDKKDTRCNTCKSVS